MKCAQSSKLLLSISFFMILSACSVHSGYSHRSYHGGHHHSHHRSSVHIHGHAHGKPATLLGVLAVGAIIGHLVTEASTNTSDHPPARHRTHYSNSDQGYFMQTLDGECFYVGKDPNGVERQTQVDHNLCHTPQ